MRADKLLIDDAQAACDSNKLEAIKRLSRVSFALHQLKNSIAFNSPLLLEQSDIDALPKNVCNSIDMAKSRMLTLRSEAAASLDLIFSPQMPVGAYAELMQDYQPAISDAVSLITKGDTVPDLGELSQHVMKLNGEITALKRKKRYGILQAGLSIVRNNDDIVKAAVFGTVLTPFSSWLGCTAIGAFALNKIRKSISKSGGTQSVDTIRAKRMIVRDLQPYVDSMMSLYLGANPSAIKILSIQQKVSKLNDN